MEIAGHVQAAADTDVLLCRLAQAREAEEIVAIVRDYLSGWPTERVARLQCLDAGWAPFDGNQNPLPIQHPSDVRRIHDCVHEQCVALRDAGLDVTPDLQGLQRFLHLSSLRLSDFEVERPAWRLG
jgi:hypothetical protein